MKHTYASKYEAHLGIKGDGRKTVIVPDMVATHQNDYDQKTFWALDGQRRIRVRLRGDWYGLHTAGTGDMIVQRV